MHRSSPFSLDFGIEIRGIETEVEEKQKTSFFFLSPYATPIKYCPSLVEIGRSVGSARLHDFSTRYRVTFTEPAGGRRKLHFPRGFPEALPPHAVGRVCGEELPRTDRTSFCLCGFVLFSFSAERIFLLVGA